MDKLELEEADNVLNTQISQHSQEGKKQQTVRRHHARLDDIVLIKSQFPETKSVLCCGCRHDSEVQDFIDAGFIAQGVDVNGSTNLIQEMDVLNIDQHFDECSFDIVYLSHILEHLIDTRSVMEKVRKISRMGAFVILPLTPKHTVPRLKHPTVFEIMKLPQPNKDIFDNSSNYKNIWDDFGSFKPIISFDGDFREGTTEPYEVYMHFKW